MEQTALAEAYRSGTTRAEWVGVVSIAAGTFLMVTTEFLPIGILSQLARALGVTEGVAGLTVTVPALVAMFTAPLLTLAVGTTDRKLLIVLLTAGIVLSNTISAFAPSFLIVLLGRVILGVSVAGLWSLAVATGRRLVPETAGARVTSIISAGISVGTVAGVPVGTLIGSWLGWRAAFGSVASIGLLVVFFQYRSLPRLPVDAGMTVRRLLAILEVPMARIGLIAIILVAAGHFAAYTFLEPFLRAGPGMDDDGVAMVLAGYALSGLVGTYVGERLSSRGIRLAFVLSAALVGVSVLAAAGLSSHWLPASFAVLIWGLGFGAVPVVIQIWMHQAAPTLFEGSAAVLLSAFQVGVSAGAWVGGMIIDHSGILTGFVVSAAVTFTGVGIAWAFGVQYPKPASA